MMDKTKKGQIAFHAIWGIVSGTLVAATYYFSAQAGIQSQISDLKVSTSTSIAAINAELVSQSQDIQNQTNYLQTLNQNMLEIGEFAGVRNLKVNTAN